MDIILPNQDTEQPARIKVIGVGGGGTNAVNKMIVANVSNVEFYAVNTDLPSLRRSGADNKVQIGRDGLGVGGNPQKAELYAMDSETELKEMVSGADMVFITTGMGGGTGTGAAPVIAKISKEEGILTVGVVTRPFSVEGKNRIDNANKGIAKIREYTDALIVIPNDRLFSLIDEKTPYEKSFEYIDNVLRRSIESITDTITKTGIINIDFADVKEVLQNSSSAIIGLGDGATLDEAFQQALTNKFVEGEEIKNANKVLINISSSKSNCFTVGERKSLDDFIAKEFKSYKFLKVGNIVDDVLDTKLKVSIIASFEKEEELPQDLFDSVRQPAKKTGGKKTNASDGEIDSDSSNRPAYEYWKIKRL